MKSQKHYTNGYIEINYRGCIGSKYKLLQCLVENQIKIIVNNEKLELVTLIKYLGLIMDAHLNV